MSILDTLAEKGVIEKSDVEAFAKEAKAKNITIEALLAKKGIALSDAVDEDDKYDDLDIPKKSLEADVVPSDVLSYIPEESAQHYKFVPLAVKEGMLEVGIVDPDNIEARDALNFISSKIDLPFKLFLITQEDFDKVIGMYKGFSEEVTKALSEFSVPDDTKNVSFNIEGRNSRGVKTDIASDNEIEEDAMDMKVIEDAPITKIVATILRYAIEGEASDVHIEPQRENIRVRFRVDGVLNTSLVLPLKVHSAVMARIKILSKLRLDEKRKPQDGRFSAKIEGRKVDFRVSTFPTYFGEKIVLRILDQEKGVKKIDNLGLSARNLETIKNAIKRPYGMILISGPTGSGKTTTLYSMLNEINREEKNVLSLEDPVEYNIEGVNQSQVRPEIGYTFATGLRTTLRQDPDIIMVGEIRDAETASLAIQAALTGHLVLATIHTNNAVGVIPRLIDMGVDPYLIAPTLILAIAQRLVSMLCEGAGEPIAIEGTIQKMIDKETADLPEEFKKEIPFGKEVFRAKTTTECPSGTKGRIAVMEVLEMTKEIETILLTNPSEIEIAKSARKRGMLTMKEDAIIKAFQKTIPFEEVGTL